MTITIKSPPTPLSELELMHALCMQLEDHISNIKTLGCDEDLDEIFSNVESLTSDIQSKIDEIEGYIDNRTEKDYIDNLPKKESL